MSNKKKESRALQESNAPVRELFDPRNNCQGELGRQIRKEKAMNSKELNEDSNRKKQEPSKNLANPYFVVNYSTLDSLDLYTWNNKQMVYGNPNWQPSSYEKTLMADILDRVKQEPGQAELYPE